jgi:hypothetical protein
MSVLDGRSIPQVPCHLECESHKDPIIKDLEQKCINAIAAPPLFHLLPDATLATVGVRGPDQDFPACGNFR